jgi:excinuclease UvrABC nuclease subunit
MPCPVCQRKFGSIRIRSLESERDCRMEQQATTQISLERQMQTAVAEQKYEEAARLRDAIKTLQADKEAAAHKKKAKKKDERAIAMVERKMKQAAAKMEFEDAVRLRDAVNVLTKGSTKGSQRRRRKRENKQRKRPRRKRSRSRH